MAATKEVQFDMLRRLRVADYFTLSNGVCGVLSIFLSMEKCFITAYVLIFVGYQFDRFDGMIARLRNECSDWGKELDSFSDLITFVLAPAVMLYCVGFRTAADQAALAFYVLCGLTRLARFNIIVHLVPKNALGRASYMEGLPTPYAALIISTTVAVFASMDWISQAHTLRSSFLGTFYEVHWAILPVLALSVAMASKRLKLNFDGAWSIPATTAAIFIGCWWGSLV